MRRLTGPPKVTDFLNKNPTVNDWLYTVWERLGLYESAANPTLAEIPEKQWILHRNTTTGNIAIWTRYGPTTYSSYFGALSLTGDVTGTESAGTVNTTIANNAVTYAKMQDVSAASKLIGRGSASGAGDPQEITLGSELSMSGTTLNVAGGGAFSDEKAQDAIGAMVDASLTYVDATPLLQRSALTGAITAPAGSNTTSLGSFTKSQLDTAISDGNGMYVGDAPTAHAASHKAGGSDAIKLDEFAAPTDVLTLNASTSAHGLLPKLDGTTTNFLRGDGTWALPAGGSGSGDVVGPASAVNNNVVFFNGTTGKLIKDSGLTLSGTNTGDQTSIAGLTGTKAQFDTACTDGNFVYDLATAINMTANAGATTPAAGVGVIFVDTSKMIAFKDDAGRYWAQSYNASVANQSPGTTVTYITGSELKIPSWGHQAKTTILWKISASKTAAGIAQPIYNIRWGAAATTADTSHITLTAPAQTAVADIGTLFIELVIRTTGATGTMTATAFWAHRGTAATSTIGTGFANDGTGHIQGTATWDMTGVAGQFVGISVTTGTSAAWTIQQVSATANW